MQHRLSPVPHPRVDVHCHYLPSVLAGHLRGRHEGPRITSTREGELLEAGGGLAYPLFAPLTDLEPHRRRMEVHRIARTLLSVPPGPDLLPAADAPAAARAANDELAELPEGFGALALLPLTSPGDAEAELRRAAGLGLAGAQLFSNAAGRPLDGDAFAPLFAAAAELRMPLVLHPTLPLDGGLTAGPELVTALGFVFDTSACAARVVATGVFERHPELVLVLPHAGAVLPLLLERLDLELSALGGAERLDAPLGQQLKLLHVDAITPSAAALELAVATFGAERVLLGSDEPFWPAGVTEAALGRAQLGEDERALIERENAERIFRTNA